MKILVIIISYNFKPWIGRCLGSLSTSDYPVDVLVLDNGSQDNSLSYIRTHYPHVRLIDNQANLGFGKANNIGIQLALEEGYDAVFLMNQDAWVRENTIGILARLCLSHPEYGILSPVHLTASGKSIDPGFSSYCQVKEMSQLPVYQDIIPLTFINAAFWMIPTNVFRHVGGFSSLFYHYGEDKDFINRLSFHGYLVGYAPNVFGCHDREYRPVSEQKFLHTEYVYHLSEYANIHYSFPKAFGFGVLACFKKSLQAIFSGKLNRSLDYLSMTFRLLTQSRKVLLCRKKDIHPQLHNLFEP